MATFGNTSIETGITRFTSRDTKSAVKFTLSEAGLVSKITAHIYRDPGNSYDGYCKCDIYADDAGSPGALKGETNEVLVDWTSGDWGDFTFATAVSLTAGDYWLTLHVGDDTVHQIVAYSTFISSDAGGTNQFDLRAEDEYDDGAEDPYGTVGGLNDWTASIYATYTPVAVEVAEPLIQALTRAGQARSRAAFKSTFQLD